MDVFPADSAVLKMNSSKTGGENSPLLLPITSGTLAPVMATVHDNDSETGRELAREITNTSTCISEKGQ